MDLPTRTKQKKAESDSYAILIYKLRNVGIFRNMTESDYGIDFDIEFVADDSVTGRYIKAQVKSAEKLFVRNVDPPKYVRAYCARGAPQLVKIPRPAPTTHRPIFLIALTGQGR